MNSSAQLAAVHSLSTLLQFHTRRRLVIQQTSPVFPADMSWTRNHKKNKNVFPLLLHFLHKHTSTLCRTSKSDFIEAFSKAVLSDLFRFANGALTDHMLFVQLCGG